jgi:hypothetical protein
MLKIKTLVAAALLSGFAAVTFAQAPAVAAPKAAGTVTPAATAPADATSMPKHKAMKHVAKKVHKASTTTPMSKAKPAAPAASVAK